SVALTVGFSSLETPRGGKDNKQTSLTGAVAACAAPILLFQQLTGILLQSTLLHPTEKTLQESLIESDMKPSCRLCFRFRRERNPLHTQSQIQTHKHTHKHTVV